MHWITNTNDHWIFQHIFTPKNVSKRRTHWVNVVEKFREVSDSVWVSFEAVIIEKTLKEKWMDRNYSNDNYNYYSDTIDNYNYILRNSVAILIYLLLEDVICQVNEDVQCVRRLACNLSWKFGNTARCFSSAANAILTTHRPAAGAYLYSPSLHSVN